MRASNLYFLPLLNDSPPHPHKRPRKISTTCGKLHTWFYHK